MNSEKVKDIKKALEYCNISKDCTDCPYLEIGNCIEILNADTLTLINELEGENGRLVEERDLYKEQFNELEPRFFDLRYDNQELKDRIAELEEQGKSAYLMYENDLAAKISKIKKLENQMCRNEDLHTATEKLNDTIILKQFVKMVYATLTNRKVWIEMKDWWLEGKECPPLKKLLNELAKQLEVEIGE